MTTKGSLPGHMTARSFDTFTVITTREYKLVALSKRRLCVSSRQSSAKRKLTNPEIVVPNTYLCQSQMASD